MADPTVPNPKTGWKPWVWVKAPNVPTSAQIAPSGNFGSTSAITSGTSASTSGVTTAYTSGFQTGTSFGVIPDRYLSSQNLWVQAPVANCRLQLPWTLTDPFQSFVKNAAAGSFQPVGIINGLNAAQEDLKQPSQVNWGLSYPATYPDIPRLGYCVGKLLKEDFFTQMYFAKADISTVFGEIKLDLLWRSKLKRMYLYQGEILSIQSVVATSGSNSTISTTDCVMDLGVGRSLRNPLLSQSIAFTVTKTVTSGAGIPLTFTGTLTGINSDGRCNITLANYNKVAPGDYYQLDKAICLEDPYLIDGFWIGNENEGNTFTSSRSGLGLFNTQSNKAYVVGKFEILYPLSSEITRIHLIDGGGSSIAANFHHPILKDQYIKNNNKFFKIISQFNGNVIDVRSKATDNVTVLDVTQTYSIINHYAWIINEYYMTDTAQMYNQDIYTGKIKNIMSGSSGTKLKVTVSGENPSTWVDLPPYGYHPSYLSTKSFFNRFKNVYQPNTGVTACISAYAKFQDWKLFVETGVGKNSYDITTISGTASANIQQGNSYDMDVELKGYFTGLSVGQKTYISFDEKHPYEGNSNGLLDVTLSQGITKGSPFPNLCMQGYWLSPKFINNFTKDNQYIGTCNGKYFGASDDVAVSNDQATFFVTVKGIANGLSSLYHDVKFDEWVAYLDQYSNTLTLRQGTIDFSEDPRKIEVSLGRSAYKESGAGYTGTSFTPSSGYARIKNLSMTVPDIPVSTKELPMMFKIGDGAGYFGFLVSGDGKVDLNGLNQYSTTGNIQQNYQLYDNYVSPVYIYKNGQYSAQKRTNLHIGVSTKFGKIDSVNGSMTNALAEYVNSNQVISDIGFFDIIYLRDGEPIIIYGQTSDSFVLSNPSGNPASPNGYLNNSKTVSTGTSGASWKWSQNCVMMTGSISDGDTWGCPSVKNMSGDNQYPMMILNSVDYIASVYSPISNMIIMIAKCYTDDAKSYIGCFQFEVGNLAHKKFLCIPSNKEIMTDKFWFRPFARENDYFNGNNSYVPKNDYVNSGYTFVSTDSSMDRFIRVMGSNIVNAQVNTSMTVYDIISLSLMDTGLLVILFASEDGLHALYSSSFGSTWGLSGVILSSDAIAGSIIDGKLFYLNSNGIFTKNIDTIRLSEIISTSVGSANVSSAQAEINSFLGVTIVSGNLPNQRLVGHKSASGIHKVFFYNEVGLLSCVQGTTNDWKVAPNF